MITNPTDVSACTEPRTAPNRCTQPHPVWCDPTRCTADPAIHANGYRSGAGGEHRSVPIPLNFTTARWLPVPDGTAWLTEACAPWPCVVYLLVQVGETELSMPADHARSMFDALSALTASATTAEEVIR